MKNYLKLFSTLPKVHYVFLIISMIASTQQSKAQCSDLSYDVTIKEYRLLDKTTDIEDLSPVNYYLFNKKEKNKAIRKFYNGNGDPAKIIVIYGQDNYYPSSIKLPLISTYGEVSDSDVTRLVRSKMNRNYNGREGRVLIAEDQYDISSGIRSNGYLFGKQFRYPTRNELIEMELNGFMVSSTETLITVSNSESSIEYDLVNNTITDYNTIGSSKSVFYYSIEFDGELLLSAIASEYKEILEDDGLCTKLITISTFENYVCDNSETSLRSETSVTQENSELLSLYPNPTNEFLVAKLPVEFKGNDVIIRISDLTGKVIKTMSKKSIENLELIIPAQQFIQNSGLYNVLISDDINLVSENFYFTK